MKIINGVKTNLGGNYSFCDGNDKKTMRIYLKRNCRETDKEFFDRLVGYGYKKITFYYVSTCVRGYYELVAYCKI